MKPLYIFDLDGTLADISHRRHIVEDPSKDDSKWRRFYDACDKDLPNEAVIRVMESLRRFADVWIFSGRSNEVRQKTILWLCEHTTFLSFELDTALVMRAAGDYTPDDDLKQQWLNSMLIDDRKRLVAVFDDRKRVVDMWRRNRVPCFQVAEGAF
jgi:hypothetical protein